VNLPTPEQMHARGGAATLTPTMLISVGCDGVVSVAALAPTEQLGQLASLRVGGHRIYLGLVMMRAK